MPHTAKIVPLATAPQKIEPAIVAGRCDRNGFVRLRTTGEHIDRHARLAVYPRPELDHGDEVLTMVDGSGQIYVVGILLCKDDGGRAVERHHLDDGSFAEIDRSGTNDSLKVFSKANELLVDYQSASGTVRVNVESGNLEFASATGSIAFQAAKDIVFNGHRVALGASSDIHLQVNDSTGTGGPALSMKNRQMHLSSPAIDITGQRLQLFVEETKIAGKKLLGRIGNVQFITRKIESVADTVMARARNVYRTVAELSQLKAGRQRTIIEKTCHMKAQKTIFKSDNDFKVKAKKIHLG
ncbi:MAG: DUF3540 domain-containing protein [Desulfosarcina sp.]|nr:DUF3540 domain-containing protein [Desulfosarcina sp.]MBC2741662.1 DUF3540 domain-containing protein [Desulfosarcina sp.]MBC2764576.1 DUF3540 domain-containing protein [Desulfosarcina sp.]